jgi:hypothetical protein
LERGATKFRLLQYLPETNEVVATTCRRQVVVWRYNSFAPITTLECEAVDSLAVTKKDPVLIYSGGSSLIYQWERTQLNTYMYAHEKIALTTNGSKPLLKPSKATFSMRRKSKPVVPSKASLKHTPSKEVEKLTVIKMIYYDELDILIIAFEERKIMLWGYNSDEELIPAEVLAQAGLLNAEVDASNGDIVNRISGLSLRNTFNTHRDAVTGLAAYHYKGRHYLVKFVFYSQIMFEFVPSISTRC